MILEQIKYDLIEQLIKRLLQHIEIGEIYV